MIDMRDDAEIPYEKLPSHPSNLIGALLVDRSPNVRIAPACGGNVRRTKGASEQLLPFRRRPESTTQSWSALQARCRQSPELLDSCPSINPVMTTSENDTQDTPLHGPNLILDVENFGPIAEAKNIEFKPMTVFVGPSNTGKTYLAMLLHAFSQAMNNTGFPYIFPIRFAPSVDVTEDQSSLGIGNRCIECLRSRRKQSSNCSGGVYSFQFPVIGFRKQEIRRVF